jgi:hypothetical protein
VNAAPEIEEGNFYRSPFIALSVAVGPAIGFVLWVVLVWLIEAPAAGPNMSFLGSGLAWFFAYIAGLLLAGAAVVIFVIIGAVFNKADFLSMLVSAVLSPVVVFGFMHLSGYLRGAPNSAINPAITYVFASIAAMTLCWFIAGAVRARR